MTLFNKHESCRGMVLWKSKRHFVQIWYCPRGYRIKPHSHPNEAVELMYLFGNAKFFKKEKRAVPMIRYFQPKWYHFMKCFSIGYDEIHWFTVSNLPLIFINFAKFKPGHTPMSASQDWKDC